MSWLLSPLSWLMLAILMTALSMRTRILWAKLLSITAVLGSGLAMTPLVANTLTSYLERAVMQERDCRIEPPSTVVVLAGGVDRFVHDPVDYTVLNLATRRRVDRGVLYWREGIGRHIVLSGGIVQRGKTTHATLMHAYARWLGVPENEVLIEPRSHNTWQNAHEVATLIRKPLPRIALVTSATHMPRAVLAFESAGFRVCPIPCDFRTLPVRTPGALIPRTSSLLKTEAALHELIGLAYYHWLASRDAPVVAR